MGLKTSTFNQPKKKGDSSTLDNFFKKEILFFGSSFNSKKKEQFYTELSVLLNSGIRLKDALYLISESQKKKEDALFFKKLRDHIIAGDDFSKVLMGQKEFTRYEEHSIRIGEQSGTLTSVSSSLSDFYKRKNEQRRNIVSALTYPAIVLGTAMLAVIFMLQFVVPMFKDTFRQNNVELPAITKAVIAVSEGVGNYGWIFLLLLLTFLIVQRSLNKKAFYCRQRDLFLLKIPFLGLFVKVSNIARFTQAVSLLINAKVSIPQSIKLAKEMIDFVPIEDALNNVEQDLIKGESLSKCLSKHSIFDSKMVALVRVAEQTNKTEFVFQRLNEQYNQEVLRRSKQFSTVLEPLIILVVGIIVAVILIAMYLPMFELGNVLK
ncbi:general secretion pathway protein F [Dokdonia sp. MED134]|uniref:type II secretion system F family protein n=1 Tax=Dokdonia sp. MED134 TaxID=313590 RepID=UPI000068CF1D|nr:type II secretion system F family protein [Dokdonia sp. MED134]EAQ39499.1 general secretion pathway protein F [Dokdonia sp. MED134]